MTKKVFAVVEDPDGGHEADALVSLWPTLEEAVTDRDLRIAQERRTRSRSRLHVCSLTLGGPADTWCPTYRGVGLRPRAEAGFLNGLLSKTQTFDKSILWTGRVVKFITSHRGLVTPRSRPAFRIRRGSPAR